MLKRHVYCKYKRHVMCIIKVKVIKLVHLWVYTIKNNLGPDKSRSNDLVVKYQCIINIVK